MTAAPLIQISGVAGRMDRYAQAVLRAGGNPLPAYAPAVDSRCAGLVLCGGGDLDPALFGQEDRGSLPPDPLRDRAELVLVHSYLERGLPILAICRGMQVLNVALGGDLLQDLGEARRPLHRGERDVTHPIRTAPGSLLERLLGPASVVNSAHHQAVDRLGRELRPTAWAPDGTTEGLEHLRLPAVGVQFHPERLRGEGGEPLGDCLFRWLTIQCTG